MSEQAKPMLCDDCGLPVGSGPYYHTGGRISGCHMALMAEVAALRAALDQERSARRWHSIETAPSGQIILIHYKNAFGNSRVIKARHVRRWTEECSVEFEEGCGEYSEELDAFFITEGWWEQVDNWPEWCEIRIDEGVPDHWQPLPAPPSKGER